MPPDIFISYRRKDSERVLPLVQALREQSVAAWVDHSEINEFAPITDAIRNGLSESKALLAWYSADYPKSRPCQMELTAAFLAAQREGDPRRRVLVINPEGTAAHIEPIELRDAQYAGAPDDGAGYAALARRIKAYLATLAGPLGTILPIVPPSQHGLKLAGASRFVGRLPDLWRIHSALHAAESAIISGTSGAGLAQVSGLGGVGKSLLAEEYALRFGAAYPGGILWLRAFGNDPTRVFTSAEAREAVRIEQFAAVATAMGIDIKGLEPAQVEASLGAKLSQQGKPFLWVVDDLGSGWGETVRAWLAPPPYGKTLVTTRSREYSAIGTALPLGVLTAPEAFELLCARRKPVGADESAAAHGIAGDLGYHALAVDVTGAALEAQAGLVSFAQFRDKLANAARDELELAAELTDMLPSGHEKSVAATLLRSFGGLSEEGQDFLRLAALLAVAPIAPTLVAATFGRVDGLDQAAARERAGRALAEVEKSSLSDRREGNARLVHTLVSRTVRFHDARPGKRLLQALLEHFIRTARFRDSGRRTAALRTAAVTSLAEVLVEEVSDIRNHAKVAAEVQHARALCAAALPDADRATLAALVARHDFERGLYAVARDLQEQVLAAQRRLLGEEHPDTLISMGDLALTLRTQGDLARARNLQEQVVTAVRRLLGEEHPDTLIRMNNLALTVSAQGDFAGARDLQEQVLAAERRMAGGEHPDTLRSMSNLAETLRAQGDFAGARNLQGQVFAAQRRLLGEGHPNTLLSMNNLAETLRVQGDFAGARDLQEQVLAAERRMAGGEHPDTLRSMNNLALTLSAQGDLAGARDLQEQVFAADRRLLGEEHPNTLRSMNNLAETLRAQGDLAGARDLQQQMFETRRRLLGEEHPNTLRSMSNLAVTLHAQGDFAGARHLQEQVFAAQRRLLGEEHPDTLMSVGNLAEALRAQGDLAGARNLHEQVLAARRRVLGEEHPDTLTSMNNLALTLSAQGDLASARDLHEQVLAARRRLLREEHPETLRSINNLAVTLHAQGDLAGARDLEEQVLAGRRRVLGDKHPDTTLSAWNLALTLLQTQETEAAHDVFAACLAWLPTADDEILSASQRTVRGYLERTPFMRVIGRLPRR